MVLIGISAINFLVYSTSVKLLARIDRGEASHSSIVRNALFHRKLVHYLQMNFLQATAFFLSSLCLPDSLFFLSISLAVSSHLTSLTKMTVSVGQRVPIAHVPLQWPDLDKTHNIILCKHFCL